jgi:hypothetical protein
MMDSEDSDDEVEQSAPAELVAPQGLGNGAEEGNPKLWRAGVDVGENCGGKWGLQCGRGGGFSEALG